MSVFGLIFFSLLLAVPWGDPSGGQNVESVFITGGKLETGHSNFGRVEHAMMEMVDTGRTASFWKDDRRRLAKHSRLFLESTVCRIVNTAASSKTLV